MANTSITKALALAKDLSHIKNQEQAGRLFLSDYVNKCDLETYLTLYQDKMNKEVYDFWIRYASEINQFLIKNESLNYHNKDYFSAQTIVKNYFFQPYPDAQPFETPLLMFLRVAIQLYLYENSLDLVFETAIEMALGYYIHASPTLFNAGRKKHQLSSCFLIPIQDSLEDILYTGIGDAGIISSLGGGLGICLTNIRHSEIGDRGLSNGVAPMCKLIDSLISYADQSGRRKGAATAFLAIWHIDLMKFIEGTDNFGLSAEEKYNSLNTCIWTNDLFFERIRNQGYWTMFCPAKAKTLVGKYGAEFEQAYLELEEEADKLSAELEQLRMIVEDPNTSIPEYIEASKKYAKAIKSNINHQRVPAITILNKICDLQIKSGMPYLCHGDSINSKSNHSNIGPINSSNLCLEIVEATPNGQIASCNLASLNLAAFAKRAEYELIEGKIEYKSSSRFDYLLLGQMTRKCVRNLNKVIDNNYYPLGPDGKIAQLNHSTRPIGLGVSGFSDAVQILDLCPETLAEIELNKKIFACIYFNALVESVVLATQDGAYEYFEDSPYSRGELQFDLWAKRAEELESKGKLAKVYNRDDDVPIEPSLWGQPEIKLWNGHIIFPTWDSLKQAIVKYGTRNSLITSLMPTASTAQMLRNAETTEYHQTNIYSRNVQSGYHIVINRWLFYDLHSLGLWDDDLVDFIILCNGSVKYIRIYFEDHINQYPNYAFDEVKVKVDHIVNKYKTQFEISQKHCIKMARQRGIYIDQSQSMNLYYEDPKPSKLKVAHLYGNSIGNKVGMYYLRANPPSRTESFGMKEWNKVYYRNLMEELGNSLEKNEGSALRATKECFYCGWFKVD